VLLGVGAEDYNCGFWTLEGSRTSAISRGVVVNALSSRLSYCGSRLELERRWPILFLFVAVDYYRGVGR